MRKIIMAVSFTVFSLSATAQKNWQLSMQTWTFHKRTFKETLERAYDLHLRYLEVYPGQQVGGGIPGTFSYTLSKEQREQVKQWMKERNIRVIAMGVVDKYYYNKDNLEKFFEFARDMNIAYITAEPEWEDLDEFNRLAKKYDVKVALHCHPKPDSHYWNPDSMAAAIHKRKYIGAWPDIGHWVRSGVDIKEGLKKVKRRLWGLHFKDIKEEGNLQAADTLFGKGVCDLPGVVKKLKRLHFNGVVSLEYEIEGDNIMEDMSRNIAYFEEITMKWYEKAALDLLNKFY